MKRSKFSEEQIAYALRQAEGGTPASDVCRQLGISKATFYLWKKKFAHLGVSELRRLRQVEDENRRLKQLVAVFATYGISVHRACRLAGLSRTGWYCRPTGQDQAVLRARIRELAHTRPAVWIYPDLGLAPPRGLAGQCETGAAALPAGGAAAPDAHPPAQAHRLASGAGARAARPPGALEHGLCTRSAG